MTSRKLGEEACYFFDTVYILESKTLIFSWHRGEEGVKNPPNLRYVIYECSLMERENKNRDLNVFWFNSLQSGLSFLVWKNVLLSCMEGWKAKINK